MLTRCISLALVAAALALTPLRAQTIAPVAVGNHYGSSQLAPVRMEPQTRHIGPAPFVILGALAGAGAVTAVWVHEAVVSARENGNDGMIIPPIVFVTIGAGGLGGGLLGWMIYDGVGRP